jgi:hypothetical protein
MIAKKYSWHKANPALIDSSYYFMQSIKNKQKESF